MGQDATTIDRHIPAPDGLSELLNRRLADAGGAPTADQTETFLLAVRGEDDALVAGCKGEISFVAMHLSDLWVAESRRGAGLGTRLLDEAETLARERGCSFLYLETRIPAAQRLYERHGYSVFGQLEKYDGTNTQVFLQKRLR